MLLLTTLSRNYHPSLFPSYQPNHLSSFLYFSLSFLCFPLLLPSFLPSVASLHRFLFPLLPSLLPTYLPSFYLSFLHLPSLPISLTSGWVTDMSPGGIGATAKTHETFIGPPLDDEDGASRVLDPIFNHINTGGVERPFGNFYKDYFKASW